MEALLAELKHLDHQTDAELVEAVIVEWIQLASVEGRSRAAIGRELNTLVPKVSLLLFPSFSSKDQYVSCLPAAPTCPRDRAISRQGGHPPHALRSFAHRLRHLELTSLRHCVRPEILPSSPLSELIVVRFSPASSKRTAPPIHRWRVRFCSSTAGARSTSCAGGLRACGPALRSCRADCGEHSLSLSSLFSTLTPAFCSDIGVELGFSSLTHLVEE